MTVLFLEGGFASTAVGPMEVFRHAGVVWNLFNEEAPAPRFRVTSASVDGEAVRCDGPLSIHPTCAIHDVRETDVIFATSTGMEFERVLECNAPVVPWLREWRERGASIAGVCTGVGLMAEAGILDGRRATTHWGVAGEYRRRYPKVHWMPELLLTEDDGLYCGGGVHAALDLSLYLVEKLCGHEVAVGCAKALLIERPRTWQSGFAVVPLSNRHGDPPIATAQNWLHENFHRDPTIEQLAKRVAMSPRNFARRFKSATGDTPLLYLQKLRVAAAKRLLEEDHRSVQEIGVAVGYEDVAFFRDVFKRHAGVSPQAYRQRFGTSR